jgi:hypothetical protein
MRTDAALMPHLVEISGPFVGRIHELVYGEHVVGRGGVATIQLADTDVSRRHARLMVTADGVTVYDLGSKNGVFVQGKRVQDPVWLGHGHTLAVGELTLRLVHPSAQVGRALRNAGETTTTATHTDPDARPNRLQLLLLPIIGILVFGGLVVALMTGS